MKIQKENNNTKNIQNNASRQQIRLRISLKLIGLLTFEAIRA